MRSRPNPGKSPIGGDPVVASALANRPSAWDKISARAPSTKIIPTTATSGPLRKNPGRSPVAFGGTAVACI